MKYVFVVNPNSGKSGLKENLLKQLETAKETLDYEFYMGSSYDETIEYVNNYCLNTKNDVVFCACGGDRTINAVVNGAINHKNAIVTCYPCGSGNDFVKVYGGKEKFLNIDNIVNGIETRIDVMKVNDKYAVNVTNFGFDAAVCDVANKVRRKKIIGGKRSYTTGIIVSIFKSMKTKCKVIVDNEVLAEDKILLSTVANGKYVGGAYLCAPDSDNEDGLLEVCVIRPISLFKFISLIKPYKQGKQLHNPKFDKYIKYRRAKEIIIEADDTFKICLDGEIYRGSHFEIKNLKQVLRFIKPKE
jgi:diacylglycerol kinase (ATP)